MCSLIVAAALLITPSGLAGANKGTPLTLTDILHNTLLSPIETIDWMDSDRIMLRTMNSIRVVNTSASPIISDHYTKNDFLGRQGHINQFSFSHDGSFIALSYANEKSGNAMNYLIYSVRSQTFTPVGPEGTDKSTQIFLWNPVEDDYAFVHMNDIYYGVGTEEFDYYGEDDVHRTASENNTSISSDVYRITHDNDTLVYNGIADWIYEEEIFSSIVGMWWSLSGQYLAFIRIDDREVPLIQYPVYGKQQYPIVTEIPYPKTGVTQLPKIALNIWDKQSKEIRQMDIILEDKSLSTYLFSAYWITHCMKDLLIAVFANRYQNVTTITICTYDSGKCVLNFNQFYSIDGQKLWAEPDNFRINYFSEDSYFVILPGRAASGEVYNQVARISIPKDYRNGKITFLTWGDYDVTSIVGYNETEKIVYFMAASPLPSQRHMYATSYHPTRNNRPKCVTCGIAPNCTFQNVVFSEDGDKYLLSCRGPGVPRAYFSSISSNNTLNHELTESKELERKYRETALATVRYENVTLSNGFGKCHTSSFQIISLCKVNVAVALVKMLLPPGFDQAIIDVKYSVIVSVYAGPGSQKVTEEVTSNTLEMFLASSAKYIIIYIDGRGSGMRGWKYKEPIYGHLGTVEIDDQIEAVRILASKYRFINSKNIAVWGWSYGGFVSAHMVEHDVDHLFKCAVSVAPVTDFKLYDATYTERYMGDASELEYEKANLMRNVSMFKEVPLLLVHGLADGNVHMQNSAELIKALAGENIQFQLMVYPDAEHSLLWVREHLFTMVKEFLEKCFER
uniref:Dipeptidyl peptidase 4 n=1 Tax=Elaeophora elaphi TaxID=1147741 RepID=A0A158Q888_9BILA